eukprot:5468272-Pyramimonas_sp.AAC.1
MPQLTFTARAQAVSAALSASSPATTASFAIAPTKLPGTLGMPSWREFTKLMISASSNSLNGVDATISFRDFEQAFNDWYAANSLGETLAHSPELAWPAACARQPPSRYGAPSAPDGPRAPTDPMPRRTLDPDGPGTPTDPGPRQALVPD